VPEELTAILKQQIEIWGSIARELGIKPELVLVPCEGGQNRLEQRDDDEQNRDQKNDRRQCVLRFGEIAGEEPFEIGGRLRHGASLERAGKRRLCGR
jgi:hypothetical protein